MEQTTLPAARILVVVGNYGSGKTEISLNLALRLAGAGEAVTLVDLDIVNPYFRSAERTQLLEEAGVKVLAPTFAMSTVDIPALPAEIQSVFVDRSRRVVFDVGGDDTGAAALGRYKPYFDQDEVQTLFVINRFRPLSSDPEDVLDLMARVQARGRLPADLLVNNSNLSWDSDGQELKEGDELLREVSRRTGVPIGYYGIKRELLDSAPQGLAGRPLPLDILMCPDWL